ncbi:GTP-binding protein YchF [uncultured Desulfobacterium sp.]|uniref:GTP-binding protein YchF n=1 Tax=uncultured Desulfobacterium sp. TaxID=201089 RepID=A0A445MX13_9BACT|nr:GTP-binding protein YchF [uncultured Desulfobacterium sp.]
MKLGIMGLPQSGRATIFSALTGARSEKDERVSQKSDARIATLVVFDERVDFLSKMYKPKKTTYAKIEYFLPSEIPSSTPSKVDPAALNQLRTCDALVHVVRNFRALDESTPSSEQDFWRFEEEMILADLVIAEKRIERIDLDKKRGKKPDGDEYALVKSCRELLEKGIPIRNDPMLATHPVLKGFTFLSARPMLVIINNDDENEDAPIWEKIPRNIEIMAVRGRLEKDIVSMSKEEAEVFLEAYNIRESVLDRVIKSSFRLLNRISFFTVGEDEVKAWPITAGTPAVKAAGAVHSDIEKGFIRAETLSYSDLKTHGTYQAAKKAGLVRLEGKEYIVEDGDIINFRFNI